MGPKRVLKAASPLFGAVLLFISCAPPFGGTGGASIAVSFSSITPRTLVPQANLGIDWIDVTVTGPGGTLSGNVGSVSGTCTIADIPPGNATVSATARSGGAAGPVVAAGSTTISPPLTVGETRPVNVDLAPAASGTGGFSFAMRWPDTTGAAYVECSLQSPYPGGVSPQTPTVTSGGGFYSCTYADSGIPSGAYDMFITFRNAAGGSVLGTFVESVNIYDNLTSDMWIDPSGNPVSERVFSENEINYLLSSVSRITITGEDLSLVYDSPAPSIDIGRIHSQTIRFTVTLAGTDPGQYMEYSVDGGGTWNPPDEPLSSNAVLPSVGPNTLLIRITSSYAEQTTYQIAMTLAFTVYYNRNGATSGTVPPPGLTFSNVNGEWAEVVGNTGGLARTGYTWLGWSTDPAAATPTYTLPTAIHPGGSNVVLYAVWATPPPVTNLTCIAASGQVTLSWNDPVCPNLQDIRVQYTGGTDVFISPGLGTQSIVGLTNGQLYEFTVCARDILGRYSEGNTVSACPGAYDDPGTYTFNVPGGTITISISGGVGTVTAASPYVTSVTIPPALAAYPVTGIAASVFANNSNLTSVNIPDSVTTIGDSAFYCCTSPNFSVRMSNSITAIGNLVFFYCIHLGSITIPDTVTTIGDQAFYGDWSLGNVTIPSSVTSIGAEAFWNDSAMFVIDIPSSVLSIGNRAFADCYSLATVRVHRDALPVTTLGADAFHNCTPAENPSWNGLSDGIYVPASWLAEYQAAWSQYASYIKAGDW